MENKQTAMYDFAIHLRRMKNQLMNDWQHQRADYYMVRIIEGIELKAIGYLAQEKEQLMEAWINGDESDCLSEQDNQLFAEQYYNETYGSSKQQADG